MPVSDRATLVGRLKESKVRTRSNSNAAHVVKKKVVEDYYEGEYDDEGLVFFIVGDCVVYWDWDYQLCSRGSL